MLISAKLIIKNNVIISLKENINDYHKAVKIENKER